MRSKKKTTQKKKISKLSTTSTPAPTQLGRTQFTQGQYVAAWRKLYEELNAAEELVQRLEKTLECFSHIKDGERPFAHEYWDESHHNGDPYRTSDTVWAEVKPEIRKGDKEDIAYTVIDMPEYEDALKRIREFPTDTPEVPDDNDNSGS